LRAAPLMRGRPLYGVILATQKSAILDEDDIFNQ
jgi:hypothetical protein